MVNGRSKHYIGGFKCQEEAAKVYDRAAIQLKGMKVSERVSESGLHQLQLHEEGSERDNARRGSVWPVRSREDSSHVLIIFIRLNIFSQISITCRSLNQGNIDDLHSALTLSHSDSSATIDLLDSHFLRLVALKTVN